MSDSRFQILAFNGESLPLQTATQSPGSAACVIDKSLGLIWEVKTSSTGLRSSAHTYSWFNANDHNNGGSPGTENGGNCRHTPCDTAAYIDAINQRRLCGREHWRLPSRRELLSLVNFKTRYPGPVINQSLFPNTVSQFYWSATPSANDTTSAWGVGFSFGYEYAYFKSDLGHVRLVHDANDGRSPSPKIPAYQSPQRCRNDIQPTAAPGRFTDNGNGTVTDNTTGLMWMRCVMGQTWQNGACQGNPLVTDMATLKQSLRQFQYADYQDWRLPGIKELSAISELACENPAINLALFPNTAPANFWSGTGFVNDADKQWLQHYLYGENHVDVKTITAFTRLVRNTGP